MYRRCFYLAEELLYLPKILFHKRPHARAAIHGGEKYPSLAGELLLYPFQAGSLALIAVNGLPESTFYGLHIHEGDVCEGDFTSAGGHYNPKGAQHPNHAGDLPNLLGNSGFGYMMFYSARFTPEGVIGKTVIIHAMPDDYKTQPAGDSGDRIACGVIEKKK